MDLTDWRTEIDEIDEQILSLLYKRSKLAIKVGKLKDETGKTSIYAPHREKQIIDRLKSVNCNQFPEPYREYLAWAHESGYTSRYIGSMVADVHRTLLKGGLFMYPPTGAHPDGKLRLMYEANPMAMIIEQAGGLAYSGTERILEIEPSAVHERCSVVLGSPEEVERVTSRLK